MQTIFRLLISVQVFHVFMNDIAEEEHRESNFKGSGTC